jgi:hypothetical protein
MGLGSQRRPSHSGPECWSSLLASHHRPLDAWATPQHCLHDTGHARHQGMFLHVKSHITACTTLLSHTTAARHHAAQCAKPRTYISVQHSITGQHLPQTPQREWYRIPITFQLGASSIGVHSPDSHTQHHIPPSSKVKVIDISSYEFLSNARRPQLPDICNLCGKRITRDSSRNVRTHDRGTKIQVHVP